MRKRLVATLLSSFCLVAATSMLVTFIELYAVPNTLTSMFIPRTCMVVGAKCGESCNITGEEESNAENLEDTVEQLEQEENKTYWSSVEKSETNQKHQYKPNRVKFVGPHVNTNVNNVTTSSQSLLPKHGTNMTLYHTKGHNVKEFDAMSNVSHNKHVMHKQGGSATKTMEFTSKEASQDDTAGNQKKQHLKIVYRYVNNTSDRTRYKSTEQKENSINMPESDSSTAESRNVQNGLCDTVYVDVVETDSIEYVPLIENPWIYYDMEKSDTSSLCTCPSCRVSIHHTTGYTVEIGGSTYTPEGSTFPCYYNSFALEAEVLLYKMSTWVVLNLMFWPTLFFMVGFVGLFFSCLYLQYEECSENWCVKTMQL